MLDVSTLSIRLFGIGSSSHEYLKNLINNGLRDRFTDYAIEDVSDVDQFISQGIESIPAIKVNDEGNFQLKDFGSLEELAAAVISYVEKYHFS